MYNIMSASVLPMLKKLGSEAVKTLGTKVINNLHGLAVKELNNKVKSVTNRTNVSGLKNQILNVRKNTTGMSNNNKRKLLNLSIQLRNKRQLIK